ncbi:MAG: glycosyltransferase family 1 protein, partial [Pseudomonadota bacterium]
RQRYFLHVGMFQPRKNHVNLIRAFQLLPRALRENYSLVMVGNYGWGCGRVVKEVRRMEGEKEARWLQGVDEKDLIALYQGCAAFVFPSLFEGFGFPVLEAFASRVPVITSNTSSLPEVSGDAALLIDPENFREIAEAMSQVVSNNTLREQLVSRGAMRASLFTWEKAAAETLAVYRKL